MHVCLFLLVVVVPNVVFLASLGTATQNYFLESSFGTNFCVRKRSCRWGRREREREGVWRGVDDEVELKKYWQTLRRQEKKIFVLFWRRKKEEKRDGK